MDTQPDASTGIQYAGWSRSSAAPTSGANIHHPIGDVMKISTFDNPAVNSVGINWNIGCGRTNFTPANTHWTLTLTNGTAEPVSSGSPLFDQNGRVVGQLHGGQNGCAPVAMHYGKLDVSWNGGGTAQTRLRDWLDPGNTGAMTTDMTLIPGLTGPDLLCTSETYTITNLPAGATVTGWSASPSGAVTISGSGNSQTVTRTGSFNGKVTLTVTLATPCGDLQVSRHFWVGYARIKEIIYGSMTVSPNTLVPLGIYMQPDGTQGGHLYRFEISGPGSYSQTQYGNYNHALSFPAPGLYDVKVFTQNGCGWSTAYYPLSFFCAVGGSMFSVYPNPADESLTVLWGAGVATGHLQAAQPATFTAILYDGSGHEQRRGESRDGTIQFDTAGLPEGTYFVHIHKGGEVEKRQVVIRH